MLEKNQLNSANWSFRWSMIYFTCDLKIGTSIQGCVWTWIHHKDLPRYTSPAGNRFMKWENQCNKACNKTKRNKVVAQSQQQSHCEDGSRVSIILKTYCVRNRQCSNSCTAFIVWTDVGLRENIPSQVVQKLLLHSFHLANWRNHCVLKSRSLSISLCKP